MSDEKPVRYYIDQDNLPFYFPTHSHEASFWESLGRAVATFGFLEEMLEKAIFALTATRPYDETEIDQAYAEWILKLERTITDPLGKLINSYGKAVKDNPNAAKGHLDMLLSELQKALQMRNILCHGSWRLPDNTGSSIPFFVNHQKQVVDSAMDRQFIDRVQQHTASLACTVIDSVTQMGWKFPGSPGPGIPIWTTTAHQGTTSESEAGKPYAQN